jgi:hypothetical protein
MSMIVFLDGPKGEVSGIDGLTARESVVITDITRSPIAIIIPEPNGKWKIVANDDPNFRRKLIVLGFDPVEV